MNAKQRRKHARAHMAAVRHVIGTAQRPADIEAAVRFDEFTRRLLEWAER